MEENNGGGEWRSGLRCRHRRFLQPEGTNPPLQFFKLILPSSIRERKLKMPRRFIRMFGKELSSNVLLTVPNGGVWQVGLEKTNGQIWFNDSLNKFIDYYSIDYGFLLLFKYEGNSSFQVLIFDTTTFEIQYPHHDGMNLGSEVKKSDSIISISSSCGCSDRFIDDEECQYEIHTQKMTRTNLGFNSMKSPGVETRHKSKRKSESCGSEFESKRCKVEDCITMEDFDVVKNDPRQKPASETRNTSLSGLEMAIREANKTMIKTRNPSFMVIIQKRNIKKSYAYIPSSFGTKYLSREDEIIAIQGGSKGQKWEISCKGSTTKRMGRGWGVFRRESKLRVGDVVVFELVKRSKNRVMKFTVFSSAAI